MTNPLGKMPVLVLPDGKAIYDSGVILDYFDTLLDEPKLFPAARRLDVQVMHALANGMMDAGVLIAYERLRRPTEFCYEPWIAHQRSKLERGLTSLVKEAPDPHVADAGSISLACALFHSLCSLDDAVTCVENEVTCTPFTYNKTLFAAVPLVVFHWRTM